MFGVTRPSPWNEIENSVSVTLWRVSQRIIIWEPPFTSVDPVGVYRSSVGPYIWQLSATHEISDSRELDLDVESGKNSRSYITHWPLPKFNHYCSFHVREKGVDVLLIWPNSLSRCHMAEALKGNRKPRLRYDLERVPETHDMETPFVFVNPVRVYRSGMEPYLTIFRPAWPWPWLWLWEKNYNHASLIDLCHTYQVSSQFHHGKVPQTHYMETSIRFSLTRSEPIDLKYFTFGPRDLDRELDSRKKLPSRITYRPTYQVSSRSTKKSVHGRTEIESGFLRPFLSGDELI